MSRLFAVCALVVVVGLVAATYLPAQGQIESHEVVWVGVTVAPENEDSDYLIGTIDKKILDEIELGKYERTFVRISNLRIEAEKKAENAKTTYLDCNDEYDWGIILVRYDDIVSIELKKQDPLSVQ